jgi:hypothetical protein
MAQAADITALYSSVHVIAGPIVNDNDVISTGVSLQILDDPLDARAFVVSDDCYQDSHAGIGGEWVLPVNNRPALMKELSGTFK